VADFLIVLEVVVALGLLVRKAVEDDNEAEHEKEAAGFFLTVLVVIRSSSVCW
jgi:hypothetical protein